MKIPALFTRRSMRPKFAIAASATFTAVSFLLISPSTRTRSLEGFRSLDLLIVREFPTTRYPRPNSACVSESPMPLEAPVTIAVGISVLLMALLSFQMRFQSIDSRMRLILWKVFHYAKMHEHRNPLPAFGLRRIHASAVRNRMLPDCFYQ